MAALVVVQDLLTKTDGDLHARLEREAMRLAAWRDLRAAYVDDLLAEGKALTILHEGKRAKFKLKGLEDGHLVLQPNKSGLERIDLEALPTGELANQIGKKGAELAEPWVRLYGFVLAGNDKWTKLLKGDDPAVTSLRADGEADYEARLRLGRCVAELNALAALDDPATPAEAQSLLTRIDALRSGGDAPELMAERAEPLRNTAALAWGMLFEQEGLGSLMKGKVKELDGGRVQIEYGFDEEAELEDWVVIDRYMRGLRKQLPELEGDKHENKFWVKGGSLKSRGQTALRHALPFEAPMKVEYDVQINPPKDTKDSGGALFFHVGLCNDMNYRFAWASLMGSLEVWEDRDDRNLVLPEDGFGVRLGRAFTVKLEHDGETVRLSQGKSTIEAECGPTSGSVFLWGHTDLSVSLKRIKIEGRVTEEGLAALRDDWVEGQAGGFLGL